jgi:methylated-DNA-[protein]-cysteine S-methyltransferase
MGQKTAKKEPSEQLAVFPTSLGWIATASRKGRLAALVFGHEDSQAALAAIRDVELLKASDFVLASKTDPLARRLTAYADGKRDDFLDVPLDLGDLTDFQRRVLDHCRRIPYGKTVTYSQLAAKAGFPGAARAVGSVMARNRIPLVIPCHRVVASDGSLGGYSGPDGVATKKRLLEMESRG